MNGLDWAALPLMVERFGVRDVEIFIEQLVAIRNHEERKREQPVR